MIGAISKAISSPTLVNIAQNSDASVICKTTVNAIGRPGFILIDSNIDDETKKFAATKEFLYQATCLGVYMALIVPIFKKGGFKLAKEKIFKNTEGFQHFKNFKEYNHYRKLASNANVNNRLKTLEKEIAEKNCQVKEMYNDTLLAELHKEQPNLFNSVKGSIDLSNIVGSVVGLAIVAPQVSQALIHPVLRFCGLEKKDENKNNNIATNTNSNDNTKLDTKA
jgi:hypothetical protein